MSHDPKPDEVTIQRLKIIALEGLEREQRLVNERDQLRADLDVAIEAIKKAIPVLEYYSFKMEEGDTCNKLLNELNETLAKLQERK